MKYKNFILILILLTTLNFSFRDFAAIQSGGAITNQVILRIIFISVLGILSFLNFDKILGIIRKSKILIFLIFILLYFILSSFWSVYPLWSLYISLELLIIFLSFTLYAELEGSPFIILKKLMIFYSLLIGISYFNTFLGNPFNKFDLQLYGLYSTFPIINPGFLAVLALYSICFTSFLGIKKNLKTISFFLFSIITLFLTQNRSSLIAFLLLFISYALFNRNYIGLRYLLVSTPLLLIINPLKENIFNYLTRGNSRESLMTLSTRTITWAYSYSAMINESVFSNLFGLGAFAGVRFKIAPDSFFINSMGVSSFTTDNFWLDTYIDNGIFGLILIICFFVCLIINIFQIKDYRFKWFLLSIIIILLSRSIFISNIFAYRTNIMFFFIVSSITQFPEIRNK